MNIVLYMYFATPSINLHTRLFLLTSSRRMIIAHTSNLAQSHIVVRTAVAFISQLIYKAGASCLGTRGSDTICLATLPGRTLSTSSYLSIILYITLT